MRHAVMAEIPVYVYRFGKRSNFRRNCLEMLLTTIFPLLMMLPVMVILVMMVMKKMMMLAMLAVMVERH